MSIYYTEFFLKIVVEKDGMRGGIESSEDLQYLCQSYLPWWVPMEFYAGAE